MSAWADVNQLQNKIEKAQSDLEKLCQDCKTARQKVEDKKKEIQSLYAQQDSTIGSILGPRTLDTILETVK